MKRLAVGLLAHVDAGKTTLSEGLLYRSGALKKLGRVDHQDAFLDNDPLERDRGITIFSKQARLSLPGAELTLLDTPGHVDFAAEMERTLQVLDCAVLVISGADGVQGHTLTLWRLLERWHIPVFLFVNKMDLPGIGREAVLDQLQRQLSDGCVDFGSDWAEQAAMRDEAVLDRYLERGEVSDEDVRELVAQRKLFPCWFGSALKLEGVDQLLAGLETYARMPDYPTGFGARVYKVARDSQGVRLTYLKVTGGSLRVKGVLTNRRPGLGEDQVWEEKVDQIRLYSGEKFQTAEEVPAGTVCAVTGLSHALPGDGLGGEGEARPPALEPVLTYQLLLPQGSDPHTALQKLRQLEEEDPQLHVVWHSQTREIHLQLMGLVQLEVLKRRLAERFGLEVSFGPGNIVYRETIAGPAEGVGHYEPLRHYAEVHLLLEPGERGSGLVFATACSEDQLDRSWQRLILTHLAEKTHLGVLTGSPITDMKLTLVAGRAHLKHTEGGDFRQATYRAVRQGLMEAESVLLEPWYSFRLALPPEQVGRAMSDIQRMNGEVDPPQAGEEETILTGAAPVSRMRDYAMEVTSYTRGRGRLSCAPAGYRPCPDQAAVAAALGYDPLRDVDNPADSVFCAHGAGYHVPWDQVREHMHVDSGLALGEPEAGEETGPRRRGPASYASSAAEEKELQAIFERTYGKVEPRAFQPTKKPARTSLDDKKYAIKDRDTGPEYLLVDGYNIIYAWEELNAVAQSHLEAARQMLMDILSNYQGYHQDRVILVFDAYKVPGNPGSVVRYHNIHVVYTKEAETADAYIEKTTYELGKKYRVRVATSDGVEQMIILGHGALRLSASAFKAEVERVEGQISEILARNNVPGTSRAVQAAMERAREREDQR